MKTVAVKISDELSNQLELFRSQAHLSRSKVIRLSLEHFLEETPKRIENSFFDCAQDLCGTWQGPQDLSCNKKHLEGYGQ
ncbi:MAG: hypothetical protein HY559_05430 [Gammaproteobacteria bacterium]|nr:hypothetical protein [Gammaproteobacteria bacterium]